MTRSRRRSGFVVAVTGLVAVAMATVSCSTGGPAPAATATPAVTPSAGCDASSPGGGVGPGQEKTEMLETDSVGGSYQLTVPETYRPRHPSPLILLFYGFDSNPTQFSALTELPARGGRDGFLVAVPHTQSGETEFQFSGHGTDADFVDGLVGSLEQNYCIDRAAVFAAGFSAGAAFTIAYSCAHENQIAAMATVAVEFQLGCRRPLSILAFHGTADPLVPYQNGAVGLSLPGIKVRGTELNLGDWARLDHCRSRADGVRIGTQVVRQQWSGCTEGTSVVLYSIIGGGHSWPGADPKEAIGLTTQEISATSLILSFFAHR
jgi:polyhydroxybutyrate depolymerase